MEELKQVMGEGLEYENSDEFFKELIVEVDLDGDGQVT